ncbi:DUF885 domain-containing protein [Flagellimonas pacifica]|nr:DUF885 domain-containing protein [Allomuricauda parva]
MKKSMPKLTVILLAIAIASCSRSNGEQQSPPENAPIEEQLDYIGKKENFGSEKERLQALFDAYADNELKYLPPLGTFMGNHTYDHMWMDVSPKGFEKRQQALNLLYETKDWFNASTLSLDDATNYQVYNRSVADNYRANQFPNHYLIVDQIQNYNHYIAMTMQSMPVRKEKDLQNFKSRMEGIATVLEDMKTLLQQGLDEGISMPYTSVLLVPEQMKSLIATNPEQSPFYQPIANLPESIDAEGGRSIQEEIRDIISQEVNPALLTFHDFMKETYLPNARKTYGLKDLPNGEAWYQERIRFHTTTDLTASDIHEIGKQEVARITQEMQAIIDELNFEGGIPAFNTFLKDDPQFYFTDPEELLKTYRDICKRIDPELPTLFGILPVLPYGIKETPAYRSKSAPAAYYMPGSREAGRAGYFYASTYDLKSRPKWGMEALSLHEAVPGHHFQIAIGQELENQPEFKTATFQFTAFAEGWGLYAESLGAELGLYTDPYQRYGRLTFEIWRAIRLVVDTGIHALDWSRQEAIDYFKANSSLAEHDITVEVDRYIAWPGQALAYKIGELKIKELKKSAQNQLGNDFDIRGFHDVVLGSGIVPLDVLENNVEDWISNQQ